MLAEKSKVRWIAPAAHLCVFAATWITAHLQSQPLLDGPAKYGFAPLFFADLPISALAFSRMWDDGHLIGPLLAWGSIGTVWWYVLGRLLESLVAIRSKRRASLTADPINKR